MLNQEFNHSWRSFTVWVTAGPSKAYETLPEAVQALQAVGGAARLTLIASEILIELDEDGVPIPRVATGSVTVNSSATAAIDRDYKWQAIDASTPRGVKLQLINRSAGVAVYGQYHNDKQGFTHWAPLPTFEK